MKMKKAKTLLKTIPLSFTASRTLFAFDLILSIISGTFGVLIIDLFNRMFDNAIKVDSETIRISVLLHSVIVYIIIMLIMELVKWIEDALGFILTEKSTIKLSELLHKKADEIEAIQYENPKLLDYIDNAGSGIYYVNYCAKNIINLFLRDIPYLLFVGIYLFAIKPILFLIPVIIFIPIIITQIFKTKLFIQLKDSNASLKRKLNQYEQYIAEKEYYKETRSLGAFSFFLDLFDKTQEKLNKQQINTQRKYETNEGITKLITLFGYYGVLFILFNELMKGTIHVGMFAAVFASIQRLYDTAEHIVCNKIGSILTNEFSEINCLISYLNIPTHQYGDIKYLEKGDISLEDVSFKYPGRDDLALDNITLNIKNGEMIAIVGENGSGKSTLAKIILGIYSPSTGAIRKDNIPYSSLDRESIFGEESAVFQDYYRYLFKLDDNILISMLDEINKEKLNKVCDEAGVEFSNKILFPDGYNTMLSKQYGGVELSGGEWQRVAIARGLYRNGKLVILDEPTASIDPIEEGSIYKRFMEISKNNTSIVITHRLGLTKLADRIVVLNNGRIEQLGNHDTLIKENGIYKQMYEAQAQWYV